MGQQRQDWQNTVPEITPTLLLTRPWEASVRLERQVSAATDLAFSTIISPLLKVEPIGQPIDLNGKAGVILTSVNGVDSARWSSSTKGKIAYCVGDRTAQAARDAGFDAISAQGDANDLVRLILSRPPKGALVHVHGEMTRGDVSGRLQAAQLPCIDAVVYRQIPLKLSTEAIAVLSQPGLVVVPIFSPNTARGFVAQAPYRAAIKTVAISAAAEASLSSLPRVQADVAKAPNQDAMVAAICGALGSSP